MLNPSSHHHTKTRCAAMLDSLVGCGTRLRLSWLSMGLPCLAVAGSACAAVAEGATAAPMSWPGIAVGQSVEAAHETIRLQGLSPSPIQRAAFTFVYQAQRAGGPVPVTLQIGVLANAESTINYVATLLGSGLQDTDAVAARFIEGLNRELGWKPMANKGNFAAAYCHSPHVALAVVKSANEIGVGYYGRAQAFPDCSDVTPKMAPPALERFRLPGVPASSTAAAKAPAPAPASPPAPAPATPPRPLDPYIQLYMEARGLITSPAPTGAPSLQQVQDARARRVPQVPGSRQPSGPVSPLKPQKTWHAVLKSDSARHLQMIAPNGAKGVQGSLVVGPDPDGTLFRIHGAERQLDIHYRYQLPHRGATLEVNCNVYAYLSEPGATDQRLANQKLAAEDRASFSLVSDRKLLSPVVLTEVEGVAIASGNLSYVEEGEEDEQGMPTFTDVYQVKDRLNLVTVAGSIAVTRSCTGDEVLGVAALRGLMQRLNFTYLPRQ